MIVASIDIGTNTVLLLIAKIDGNTVIPLHNEYRIPRLGKGLKPGKDIPDGQLSLLFQILDEYKQIIESYNCLDVILTGTFALRVASNSNQIINKIKKRYNYELQIISGDTEARLAYLGAISGFKTINGDVVIIDIGGGSTELIFGDVKSIKFKKSFSLGTVNCTEEYLNASPPGRNKITHFLSVLDKVFANVLPYYPVSEAIAIAGTATTLASMCIGEKIFSESNIDLMTLKLTQLELLAEELSELTAIQIGEKFGIVTAGREDIIFSGNLILLKLMRLLNLNELKVTSRGIRYGAIIGKYFNQES